MFEHPANTGTEVWLKKIDPLEMETGLFVI
jgi:hypothetical protein